MASRRYRSKNTLNSNISDIDNRLQKVETRPAPRRIAANAIGAAQLQEEAVGEGVIAPGVIEGASIAGGAVGAAQIQDLIVTAEKIFDGAITSVKIAEGAVTSAALAANSVTAVTIAVGAVVNEKLAANAVQSINIVANAIDTTKIAADAVTSLQIAANAVGSLEIAPNSVVIGKIAANAVDSAAIEAAAITGTKIAANAVTANAIMANSITASKIDAAAVTANAIAANAITANAIAANAVTANAISANSITGVKIAANTITGNNILAGSVTGDRITANTLYGNTIVANTLFGNSIVANTLSGNTVIANTLIGNSIVANTLNGNTVIANSLSGNVIVANTLRGNTIIANTISGNTIIANTLSGNTVIANSLMGNTVVANTLFGNAIVAGTITGDRITGTTTIRLADSLLASPANYIQFGYITLPGASSAGPGIMGAYSSTPSFFLGGFNSGGLGGSSGFSLGIYDNQGGSPVPFDILTSTIANAGGASAYNISTLDGGIVYVVGGGGSYSDPAFGGISLNTGWGDLSLNIQTAGTVNGNGTYAKIRLNAPVSVGYAGPDVTTTNLHNVFTMGLTSGTHLKFSNRQIQALNDTVASSIFINPLGGFTYLGDYTAGSGALAIRTNNTTSAGIYYDGSAILGVIPLSGTGRVYAQNVYGNVLTTSFRSVYITSSTTPDTLGYVASSRRFKKNIEPLSYTAEQILSVAPVQYHYNQEEDSSPKHAGMIAEEMHDAGLHGYISYDEDGLPETIQYEFYVSALQVVARAHAEKLASLESLVASLTDRIETLENN